MTRYLFLLLLSIANPASAIYKCDTQGKITYSDSPCSNSLQTQLSPVHAVSREDIDKANRLREQEEKKLKSLESARKKIEANNQKAEQKRRREHASLQKKCAALALRVKWSEEDAVTATGKSAFKIRRAAQRHNEKYEAECKNNSLQK